MAGYTITSSTFGIATTNATLAVGSHAQRLNLWVQYTKGDETALTLSVGYINSRINASTVFKGSTLDTATVAQQVFTITGTSNYMVPLTIPASATKIQVAIGSTGSSPTGTVVIDGYPDIE